MNEALKAKIERVSEKCVDLLELFIEESKRSGDYRIYWGEMNDSFETLKHITDVICKLDTYNSEAYTLGSSGITCKSEKTPYKCD